MREFGTKVNDAFVRGLRPDDRSRRKRSFLTECYNLKPDEPGLRPALPPTDPFNGNEVVTWPFPHLHRGKNESLLLNETAISEVDETAVPWIATEVTTYDAFNTGTLKSIPAGGPWHVADHHNAWYAFNGTSVVFRTGLEDGSGNTEKTYVQDQITIRTGCSHRGRTIIGGLAGDVWSGKMQSILNTWQGDMPAGLPDGISEMDGSWVMWGGIGGGDFPLWLFYPDDSPFNLGPSEDRFVRKLKANDLGWMPMPFQGDVLNLKPLGDNVIAYGEDGIAALTLQGSTFGNIKLRSIGIADRGAVGGDDQQHVFLADDGTIWVITPDLNIRRLGYGEYGFDLLGNNPVITFDPNRTEYYLGSSGRSFILTNTGLGETGFRVAAMDHSQGGLLGLYIEDVSDIGRVVTEELDMSLRGRKMVTSVGVNARGNTDFEVCLYFRYGPGESWMQSNWYLLNPEGNARFNIVGTDFKVGIRGLDYTETTIEYLHVKYQPEDKRYARGPYIETNAGQTNS